MTVAPDFDAERTRLWIPHFDLTVEELPPPRASWADICVFAEFFPGSIVLPEHEVRERFAVAAREAFEHDGTLPKGLTMLRTALSVERRFPHYGGPRDDPERMRYAHGLLESIRQLVSAGAHTTPPSSTAGGIQDKVMNAYDRLLIGYADWGGWRYHGWDGYESPATYLGPAIWSERDCGLRLAFELEREWPGGVHMEFPIAKWTRGDFQPPEAVQHVDVSVSEFAHFQATGDASPRFKKHLHEAFFEVKWCTKGWEPKSRELKARRTSIPEDVLKLANHIDKHRCVVAGMVVFDDEGWFEHQNLDLYGGWPEGVWRLDIGPHPLRWRGLITHAEYEETVKRHAMHTAHSGASAT